MTITAATRRRSTRDRCAVSAVFLTLGLVLGTWAAHLPAVKHATHASSSAMGSTLLVLGAGALLGMQVSGALVLRFGSRRVAVAGAVALAFALVPPLMFSTWLAVTVAALALGLAVGVTEVGMNAAAVEVERAYQRPIMASFHGVFSIGSVVGALLAAAAFAGGVSVHLAVLAMASLALIVCGAAAMGLLHTTTPADTPPAPAAPQDPERPLPRQRWRTTMLGVLAFLLLLTEGSAMDWSSLHSQQHLGATSSAGAVALASFVSAMTVGRFTIDRVAARMGPVSVLRWGSVIAVCGLIVVTQAPQLPLSCCGWALLGMGLSGCVPQVFTATGNLPGASAKALSRVVGVGYLAVLAGPAIVGWLADTVGLNTALVLPLAAMAICACAAGTVAPRRPV
ncbi:MFS transporter [Mycolicibacterium hodleri]|uniref:MFS transporter n=1 Tax=Mycolicibacterium hodleri TaxID=49897 RepID=UPI001F238418|nr:MFS transporter [Mycolicibacterium hodleri]